MNLRQLANVIAVIEKGSLGKAAEALHIAQPALTKSIRRLEQELGVPLFSRDSRGMRATVYGECLWRHAQGITVGVTQTVAEISALKAGSKGLLIVGAPPLIASEIVAGAVVELTERNPGLQVRVITTAEDLIPGLLAGEYNFIVTVLGQTGTSGLKEQPLFEDRLVVIARRGHPVTRLPHIHARHLAEHTWVLPPSGNLHRRRFDGFFEAERVPAPRPTIESSSTAFIREVTARSNHLGFVSKVAVEENRDDVAVIEVNSPFWARPIGIIRRELQVMSRSEQLLVDALQEECTKRSMRARPRRPK